MAIPLSDEIRALLDASNFAHLASRVTSLSPWIATLKRRAATPPALAFDVHSAVGRPARTTAGLVPAAMSGIRSIREAYAQRASTSGLQPNVSLAPAGRRIRTGMRSDSGSLHAAESTKLLKHRD
jgi:hypothetical protein